MGMNGDSVCDWENVKNNFENYLDKVIQFLYEHHPSTLKLVKQHFQKAVLYNLPRGKRIRGVLVVASFLTFNNYDDNYQTRLSISYLVGWCIELLHAGFLVLDDIMDNSLERRGKPCWYRTQLNNGLGLISINDGLHLILAAKYLLSSIFGDAKCWSAQEKVHLELLKLFDEVSYRTCSGQCLDVLTSSIKPQIKENDAKTSSSDFSSYSSATYEAITHWKTGFYTFYLPVACGMIIAEVSDNGAFKNAQSILLKLGQYFQVQDDYLDCFGDSRVTGKIGTDIIEGKCSWLIVTALQHASEEQLQILKDHYGQTGTVHETAVRQVYETLNLQMHFQNYEIRIRNDLMDEIKASEWNFKTYHNPKDLFCFITNLIFQRSS